MQTHFTVPQHSPCTSQWSVGTGCEDLHQNTIVLWERGRSPTKKFFTDLLKLLSDCPKRETQHEPPAPPKSQSCISSSRNKLQGLYPVTCKYTLTADCDVKKQNRKVPAQYLCGYFCFLESFGASTDKYFQVMGR